MNNKTHPPRSIQTWADWEAAVKNKSCTEAEISLVTACREGRQCVLGNGTRPNSPTPRNQIGADLLRYLIKGGCDACDLHDWGVDLVGAYITGLLDLRLAKATGVTQLQYCRFDASIIAVNARLQSMDLSGSNCQVFFAQGAKVKGDVFLNDGFVATGAVSLAGAVIGGQLACRGSKFENAGGDALNAQGVEVKEGVFLCDGFAAKGEVSLSGAKIGGQLACDGGSFENAEGDALNAQGAEVKDGVFLSHGFAAKGAVSLAGAVIGGQLSCTGGGFDNAGGDALNAQGIKVIDSVFLRKGFAAKGVVRLSSAVIGGQLNCDGGSFESAEGPALNAQGLEVKGSVLLEDGFVAKGEVNLSGAVIGGQLACSGGSYENAGEVALDVQDVEANSLMWRNVKTCVGSINLAGARLQNLADDTGSWNLVSNIFLDGLTYQTIHGPLDTEMRLKWLAMALAHDGGFSPQPYEQLAWTLKRMGHTEQRRAILIEKEKRQRSYERAGLRFRRRMARLMSRLSAKQDKPSVEAVGQHLEELSAANIEFNNQFIDRFLTFHDSWPEWAQTNGVPAVEVARAQAGFREQIFWANGRIRARIAWMHLKDWAAWLSVGYGYRPFNSVWALLLLIVTGWGVAHMAYEQGDFAPNSDVILSTPDWQALAEGDSANPARDWAAATGKGRDYETFHSLAYAVDVVIPIISIGQEAAWAPSTTRGPWGHALWWLRWILTGLGWIVTAVGAAAITGVIRRD